MSMARVNKENGIGCKLWMLLTVCASLITASLILLAIVLVPLWYEMDRFIANIIGLPLPWTAVLLVLAIASYVYCITQYVLIIKRREAQISSPRLVNKIAISALIVIWSILLLVLLQESAYSLPSISPAPRLLFYFCLLFIVQALIFTSVAAILRRRGGKMERWSAVSIAPATCLLLCILCLVAGLVTHRAASERWPAPVTTPHADWKAPWITAPECAPTMLRSAPENTWLCFRKTFSITERPVQASVRIAADTKYWFWVNGAPVIFEGGLKRGPNPYDSYYDTVDISRFLRRGDNTVAVLLWHFGRDGFAHKNSGAAGLIVDCRSGDCALISDMSWKVRLHPAYYTPSGPAPNFRLAESNIGFDAREDVIDWVMPEYDDAAWQQAKEMGKPPCAPWGNLVERPIKLFRFGQLREYAKVEKIKSNDGKDFTIRCALPYNAQVTPFLRVNAVAGERIAIMTDNYTAGGARNVRAEYITRAGVQEYELPGWMNGHVVIYSMPANVEVLALKYRESGYPADFAGSFECSDSFFNRLWGKARRTLYVCMRDTYMDCPDRERAQWWNAGIEAAQAFYALDRESDRLMRKGMLELVSWQRADGVLYSPVPSGNWNIELPLPMLSAVGEYGFWNYYLHTGDRSVLERVYPAAMRYLSLWKVDNDGLALVREGEWNWGDWGENIDMPVLTSAWYYLALKGLNKIATVLGHERDAKSLADRMAAIENNFDRRFWSGRAYRSEDYDGETDDRANALAVVAGLVPPVRYEALRKVLAEEYHASSYMEKFVLEALFIMGYDEDALKRMKTRFAAMVESPLSTLWEGWEIGSGTYGGGTANHAWSGGGLILLSQYVAGVYPTLPGYGEFHVMPQEGRLSSIKACVPSVQGNIDLSIESTPGTYLLILKAPAGTRAVVGLHAKDRRGTAARKIMVNGALLWSRSGGSIKSTMRIVYLGTDRGYHKVHVPAGLWRFHVVY
jgi:alpha-L-rhamnosidase